MLPCPWTENPVLRLPAEVGAGGVRLALNADVPVPISVWGAEIRIPARCRICPFLFEGECARPRATPEKGAGLRLLAWTAEAAADLGAACRRAAEIIRDRIRERPPEFLATVLAAPAEVNLSEVRRALEEIDRLLARGKPAAAVAWTLETVKEGRLVFSCAWAARRHAAPGNVNK
jgi:hypothetical protein